MESLSGGGRGCLLAETVMQGKNLNAGAAVASYAKSLGSVNSRWAISPGFIGKCASKEKAIDLNVIVTCACDIFAQEHKLNIYVLHTLERKK